MLDEKSRAWIKLARAKLPDALKRRVLERCPDPREALRFDLESLNTRSRRSRASSRNLLAAVDQRDVVKDEDWCSLPQRSVIGLTDHLFPSLLKEISCPPIAIFCEGEQKLLRQQMIAMVGSRKPTPAGLKIAEEMAAVLSSAGFTVVSGLAIGIDTVVHVGALSAFGSTIGVCATGLDRVYPKQNTELARDIVDKGVLISEFPVGTPVRKHHFPRRNRMISGLAVATVVVEAAIRSGSLITAGFAADQGREVFAVPGSVYSPVSRGPHHLIRDGACLVESGDQILEALGGFNSNFSNQNQHQKPPQWSIKILSAIDFIPTSIDQIAERSGLTISEICAMLIRMECEKLIATCSAGYIRLV